MSGEDEIQGVPTPPIYKSTVEEGLKKVGMEKVGKKGGEITRSISNWFRFFHGNLIAEALSGKQKETDKPDSRSGLTRREFLVAATVNAGEAAVYFLLISNFGIKFLGDLLVGQIKQEGKKREEFIGQEEMALMYLFSGSETTTFARDLSIFSQSINPDTGRQVIFTDKNTWGNSELLGFFESTDRLFNHALTADGRNNIRSLINKNGANYQSTYDNWLTRWEGYLTKNNKTNATPDDLKNYFKATTKDGGLGYKNEEADLIFNLMAEYKKGSPSLDSKNKINEINKNSGSNFLIP